MRLSLMKANNSESSSDRSKSLIIDTSKNNSEAENSILKLENTFEE